MDSEYVPYESLPTFGAVAQTSLSIGEDLYLAVLSDLTNTLDIYEVLPSEVSRTLFCNWICIWIFIYKDLLNFFIGLSGLPLAAEDPSM